MKVFKDSVIYLVGELSSKLVPFLLLPYLSRKLGVEGYGSLSYYQTFLSLFLIVVSLTQEGAISRYFYFYGKRSLNLVVNTGYAYTTIIGSIILIGCWIAQSEILFYAALSSIFQSFLNVQLSVRQCQKKAWSYAFIQFSLTVTGAVFTVALLEYYQNDLVEKRILAILLSNLVVWFFSYFLYRKSTTSKKYQFKHYQSALFYILGFGLPLILHYASFFLKGQLDRIFIYHKFSETDLGLYAMGAQLALIVSIAIQALNKAIIPYFYESLKQKKLVIQQLHKWALFSFLLIPIPALIIWIIPEDVLVWILGSQFVGTKYYFILFLISTTLSIPYLILVNYLFYYGKNKLISQCSVLSTIIYVASLVALTFTEIKYIPYAGIIGSLSIIPILYFMTSKVSKTL
ncbi:lipooligosaccharide flippase LsgA [Haemophilus influenzae]|uniref:Lipopolysaccharide biosynthesis protein n=1 Tax=Haemophilus influenzae (strain PittGG) TaxID=374931 RepID=A5UFD7_HAEIG|nr:lipooligosaccharide flippase LsgA [Haemophilus influenzae]ABQ99492.1 lipopolysaccharide biosynthesis protein [Haemophilus influenzae PittGG]MCK8789446.1 lipooligosaccharide flippase LsgA [Haemophilus influenzae]MCK8862776.1 lipooligosaccharide flippase LsgA [Haemophilus influenzae]MCK8946254.1 lipooligosaccharide flippase LsgA [Haemophilus influenzae]MCK9060107.1 lipooligosaccharide flippase LsgA [Haemophilus influenzae]